MMKLMKDAKITLFFLIFCSCGQGFSAKKDNIQKAIESTAKIDDTDSEKADSLEEKLCKTKDIGKQPHKVKKNAKKGYVFKEQSKIKGKITRGSATDDIKENLDNTKRNLGVFFQEKHLDGSCSSSKNLSNNAIVKDDYLGN